MKTAQGKTPAPAIPAALDRASFFPDQRRRRSNASNQMLRAFRAAALCPKPQGSPAWHDYAGKSLSYRLSARERRVFDLVMANADFLGVRAEHPLDIDGRPYHWTADQAYFLLRLPAQYMDDFCSFDAALEDFEVEDDDLHKLLEDDLCGTESGEGFTWGNPGENDDRGDPEAGSLERWGAWEDDDEADAVEHLDQRHRCDGRHSEDDAGVVHDSHGITSG
jgi:hypothetical protein